MAAAISCTWLAICSENVFASSSWTFSLFSLDFISVAMIGSTPWRRSQMSFAMSTTPMPPATVDTTRASTEPTRRAPTRSAMLASWRRIRRMAAPAMPPLDSRNTAPGEISAAALPASTENSLLASPPGRARDRRPVARADERLEAGERRLGRILAGKLDLLADLVADRQRQLLERALHRVGAIDALGDGGRQLLRLLLVGERLHEVCPARLLGDLVGRLVDLLVDDVVEAAAAPGVADDGAVVDLGDAGFQRAYGDRLDGGAECRLVARLAGLIVGLRKRIGGGWDVAQSERERHDAGDEGAQASDQRRPHPPSPQEAHLIILTIWLSNAL